MSAITQVTVAMGEETTVSLQDMETYLEPEEYQKFLKAKGEVDEYREKQAEYDKNRADAEQSRAECRKKRDEAKTDDERHFWDAEERKHRKEASTLWLPYYSVHYVHEHDRYLDLVRERKVEEERRKEKEKKRRDALECIDPPVDDAKRYLSDQEYQQFRGSLLGAADAYIGGGRGCFLNDWRLDRRAGDYMGLTGIIKKRKKEEARQKQAQLEHDRFVKEIDDSVKKIKQELAKVKKPKFAYPQWLAGYQPDLWCELALPTEQQIEEWARPRILEKVPSALVDFVSWDLSWQVQTQPEAKYEVLGVPCLTWCFTVFILVKVHLRLIEKKFTRDFQGYRYEMKVEAEDLGTFYPGSVLGGHPEGFSTPIALLSLLAKGELEAPGIEVVEHGCPFSIFAVKGFEEEAIGLHDDFRKFIKDMANEQSLSKGLRAKGLIDDDTANLIEAKVNLPLPQPVSAQPGAGGSTLDNSDVIAALDTMGFKKAESQQMVQAADLSPDMPLEEKIKAVLKNIDS